MLPTHEELAERDLDGLCWDLPPVTRVGPIELQSLGSSSESQDELLRKLQSFGATGAAQVVLLVSNDLLVGQPTC